MDPIWSLVFGLSEGLLQAALGTGVSLTRSGIDSLPKPTFTSAVEIRSGTHRESRCINELLGKGTRRESFRKNEANGNRSLKSRTVSAIHCDVSLGGFPKYLSVLIIFISSLALSISADSPRGT